MMNFYISPILKNIKNKELSIYPLSHSLYNYTNFSFHKKWGKN